MRFKATQDFHSDELRSEYCAGLTYSARAEDDTLLALIPQWEREGKVEVLDQSQAPTAEVSADGIVK